MSAPVSNVVQTPTLPPPLPIILPENTPPPPPPWTPDVEASDPTPLSERQIAELNAPVQQERSKLQSSSSRSSSSSEDDSSELSAAAEPVRHIPPSVLEEGEVNREMQPAAQEADNRVGESITETLRKLHPRRCCTETCVVVSCIAISILMVLGLIAGGATLWVLNSSNKQLRSVGQFLTFLGAGLLIAGGAAVIKR